MRINEIFNIRQSTLFSLKGEEEKERAGKWARDDERWCFVLRKGQEESHRNRDQVQRKPFEAGRRLRQSEMKIALPSIRCSPDLWLKVLAHNYTTADARKSLTQSTNRERERKTCHFDLFRSESQTGEPIFQDDRTRKKKAESQEK